MSMPSASLKVTVDRLGELGDYNVGLPILSVIEKSWRVSLSSRVDMVNLCIV